MKYILAILVLVGVWLAFSTHKENPNRPSLPDAEQYYYEQVFDYTMDNIPAGSHYDWKTYDTTGSIAVDQAFISKSGYTCRSFAESYSVRTAAQSDQGYACKRMGRIGWCKLKPDNALTCAMESPTYHINAPGMPSAPNVPDITINAPTINSPYGNTHTNAPPPTNNGKPGATDAANTVTGTAGTAAGYLAKNAGGWFSNLFR